MNNAHIAIPSILKVGKGALKNIGNDIRSGGMDKAVIYFGNGLIDMFGSQVMDSLREAGVTVLEYRELDSVKIEELVELAFSIDNNPKNRRAGAFLQEGELSVNLQNGQRRQASVTLSNLDGEYDFNVNRTWFGQQIRLMEGLILPDGMDYYLPQGYFT